MLFVKSIRPAARSANPSGFSTLIAGGRGAGWHSTDTGRPEKSESAIKTAGTSWITRRGHLTFVVLKSVFAFVPLKRATSRLPRLKDTTRLFFGP